MFVIVFIRRCARCFVLCRSVVLLLRLVLYLVLLIHKVYSFVNFVVLNLSCNVTPLPFLQSPVFVGRNLFRICFVTSHTSALYVKMLSGFITVLHKMGCTALGTYFPYPVPFFILATFEPCCVFILSLILIPCPIYLA